MKRIVLFVACLVAAVPSWADEIVCFSMDLNPGWTTEGQWKFGIPQGLGGPKSYDPASGYTGKNVYGYNLAGNYDSDIPQYCLTTPAIYCGLAENVKLSFWRWLGVESSAFDQARVQVSSDGSNWRDVWTNGATDMTDKSWVYCEYNISSVADRRPTVFVRWCMGPTDATENYAGWNIDDVCLTGDLFDAMSVSPDEVFQSGGPARGPMTPVCKSYTIINSGISSLGWAAEAAQPWLDITPNRGTLPADANVVVDVCVNAYANALPEGSYADTVTFTNMSSGFAQSIDVQLHISEGLLVPVQHPTIQSALDAATEGDTVVVMDGTYSGEGNTGLSFYGKAVTLKSAHGPANCTIDGQGKSGNRGFHFRWGEGPDTVVEGFTITRCVAHDCPGAGISCRGSSPTIQDCIISRCYAWSTYGLDEGGGGIYCDNASPTLIGCTIRENSVRSGGRGGGIVCANNSCPVIVNCTFVGNCSTDWSGGAMYNVNSAPVLISCLFSDNWAVSSGGAICNWASTPVLTNCVFVSNSASGECGSGGAVSSEQSNAKLTNCTFIGNWADPLCGVGGAIVNSNSETIVTNCLLWGNSASHGSGEAAQIHVAGVRDPIINYSCVQGWTGALGGTGNIGDDPLLVAPDMNDFHLRSGSPCIDAGNNSAIPLDITTDYDGNPRFSDDPKTPDTGSGTIPIVDIGAREFQGVPTVLSYIRISGPTEINEVSGAQYICTAHYSDGGTADATGDASWSENSPYATISSGGYLTTSSVPSDQPCRITASYDGKSDDHDMAILDLSSEKAGRWKRDDSLPDFSGDGKSDLLWRQISTGYQTATIMDGLTMGSNGWFGGTLDWQIVATPDFDGDGKSDLLWRQASTGYHIVTIIDVHTMLSNGLIGGDNDWQVVATPDLNGDGKSDLLWRQHSTGYQAATIMDGLTWVDTGWIGGDLDWQVMATPDFDGDGKSDLLWLQESTGFQLATLMDGLVMESTDWLGGDADWQVVAAPDLNGDGKSDLLWEQLSTGYHTASIMDGLTIVSSGWVGGDLDWSVESTPDLNGDGKSDLLWLQLSTGYQTATIMDGLTAVETGWIGGDPDWQVIAIADFNGDGKSDLLWKQQSTGYHTAALMDGLGKISDGWIGGDLDWGVQPVP